MRQLLLFLSLLNFHQTTIAQPGSTIQARARDTVLMIENQAWNYAQIQHPFIDSSIQWRLTLPLGREMHSTLNDFLFMHVHNDEITALKVLDSLSRIIPIDYAVFEHDTTRRIAFQLNGNSYSIDPNRMFSKKGIKRSLKDAECFDRNAMKYLLNVSTSLLSYLDHCNYSHLITLHNNTENNYSIESYAKGGGEAKNTEEIYINPDMDPDDFVYTTERKVFDFFVSQKINVVLQNQKPVKDGSLSVACGELGLPYTNIESQHGHFKIQLELLLALQEFLSDSSSKQE